MQFLLLVLSMDVRPMQVVHLLVWKLKLNQMLLLSRPLLPWLSVRHRLLLLQRVVVQVRLLGRKVVARGQV